MGGSLVAAASVEFGPSDPHAVAAVFPPWWSSTEIIAAAGSAGLILAPGAAGNVVLLRSPSPDLPQRAAAAGAWLVFAGSFLTMCGGK